MSDATNVLLISVDNRARKFLNCYDQGSVEFDVERNNLDRSD